MKLIDHTWKKTKQVSLDYWQNHHNPAPKTQDAFELTSSLLIHVEEIVHLVSCWEIEEKIYTTPMFARWWWNYSQQLLALA